MDGTPQYENRIVQIRRLRSYSVSLAVLWTLLIACSFVLGYRQQKEEALSISLAEARAALAKDLLYRGWADQYGGVYAPVTATNQPNRYLADIPERDITTPAGRHLTLISPSSMLRQVFELARRQPELSQGHITSLVPLRPENAPDPWEANALRSFQRGVKEMSEIQIINGEPYMRLMRPMMAQAPCLVCHHDPGQPTQGTVRGGISVSVPIAQIQKAMRSTLVANAVGHCLFWLLGLAGIGLGAKNLIGKAQILEQSELRFRSTFEQAPIGIAHMAPDGKLILVNRRFCEIVGCPPSEMLERAVQDITHPDDLNAFQEHVRLLLEGKIQIYTAEQRYRRADGSSVWTILTLSLVQSKGVPAYLIGVVEDITERQKLEEQLHQSQKMESIGALAGGVAHDFNNILTVIIGNAALMQMNIPRDSPLMVYLQQMLDATERATSLTRGLLAFSRKHAITLVPVDLNSVVQNIKKLLLMVIGEEHELVITTSSQKLTVLADVGQLEQVLMNLAVNAHDAVPEGGRITITTGSETIAPEAASAAGVSPGSYATIAFSDNGSGIAKENLERIFEPFFTTKEQGKGTGLGLSIVYGIVRQHNGHIKVYSEVGYGTTFRIYLPLTREAQQAAEEAAQLFPRGNETILVAEDDENVRRIVVDILEAYGYRTVVAVAGDDAVAKFKQHQEEIALAFLDAIMPKKNGWQVYDEIKRIKPGVKVLFTSGYTDEIIRREHIMADTGQILTKPVPPSLLLTKIREILDS